MSQPIEKQQGETDCPEGKYVPGAYSAQGTGDGSEVSSMFFCHLLQCTKVVVQQTTSGAAGTQGPLAASYCFLLEHMHSHSSVSATLLGLLISCSLCQPSERSLLLLHRK